MTDTALPTPFSLYKQEGSADKEYHGSVIPRGDGYVFQYRNGRRGGTLATGTKPKEGSVSLEDAVKEFNKTLRSKLSDGYKTGESSSEYQAAIADKTSTGISIQLLNDLPDDAPSPEFMLKSYAWVMQQKFDGERRPVKIDGGRVTGSNRKGFETALPVAVASQLSALLAKVITPGSTVIDGEIIGDNYYAFDLLEFGGVDLRSMPYGRRMDALQKLFRDSDAVVPNITLARTLGAEAEKREFLRELHAAGLEGVVFKRLDGVFEAGKPSSARDNNQYRYKFWKAASLEVAPARGVKSSVGLIAYDDAGNPVNVGNVTVSKEVPAVGEIIEVKYLYAYKDGSLFQPAYMRKRPDQDKTDCLLSQLHYKADVDTVGEVAGEEDQPSRQRERA